MMYIIGWMAFAAVLVVLVHAAIYRYEEGIGKVLGRYFNWVESWAKKK